MTKKRFPPVVIMQDDILEKIEEHAYSNLKAEVGGMLVGNIDAKGTHILGSIPALLAAAEQVSLTFTHEVWEQILKTAARDFPDLTIVGWYHTHPSFGLFLSQYDSFIQDNFFKEPGQVALVIDPIDGNQAWFAHDARGEIAKFNQQDTTTGPQRASTFQPDVTPAPKAKIALAAALAAICSGVLVWALTSLSAPPDTTQALRDANATRDQIGGEYSNFRAQMNEVLAEPVLLYVVQDGDTLNALALRFYGTDESAEMLITVNDLDVEADQSLDAGELVKLPYLPGVSVADLPASVIAPTPTPTPTATPTPTPTAVPPSTPTPSAVPTVGASAVPLANS